MNWFGVLLLGIVEITTFLSYLPQLIKTVKNKNSENVSIAVWIISGIGCLAYLSYGIMEFELFIIITSATELLLASATTFILIKYQANKGKQNTKKPQNSLI